MNEGNRGRQASLRGRHPRRSFFQWARVASLFCTLVVALAGCSRPPGSSSAKNEDKKTSKREDSLKSAFEILRSAESVASYQEALRLVDAHLTRPEARAKLHLGNNDRQVVEKQFALTREEMAEVEATAFRPLDGYHVEQCFILRDAARALEQPGLDAARQAQLGMEWVARQVLLREGGDDFLPVLFVLRNGFGSARERTLVFLALMEQFRVPACVLAWPEPKEGGPRTLLVGAVGATGKKTDLYLFDPRLGAPVAGPDGKGIATLGQLLKQPDLLKLHRKEEAKARPEVLIACSMAALSPRMKYLENKLAVQDRVVLSVEPGRLLAQIKEASGAEVGVWSKAGSDAHSPTRMLRAFLPIADGGTDKTSRLPKYETQRIPWGGVLRNYSDFRLMNEQIPGKAKNNLLGLTRQLFTSYAHSPHDFLLRGRYDKSIYRLDVIRSVLDDLEFAPLEDADFKKQLAGWRDRVNQAYLALIRGQPGAQNLVNGIWNEDQFLLTLLESNEKPDPQKSPKRLLTYIVLTAVKDALGEKTHYLLAQAWQEKAERLQVSAQIQSGNKSGAGRIADNARAAWVNAHGWWAKYGERYSFDSAMLGAHLAPIRQRWQRNEFETALSMWDQLLVDVHRSAAARLLLARALQQLGKEQEAQAQLASLDRDLAPMQKGDLFKELEAMEERVRLNPIMVKFIEIMKRDLGPEGGFFWLRESARRQLPTMDAKKHREN